MADGVRRLKRVFSAAGTDEDTLLDQLLDHPLFQFVAFCIFIAALVAIVTSGFESRGAGLTESMIGSPAPHDIRATHSFSFTETNLKASEKRRDAAARAVPPVFDWREGKGEVYRKRISQAFSSMRRVLADRARERLNSERPERLEKLQEAGPGTMRRQALIEQLSPERRVAFARVLREEHFQKPLADSIADANFDTVARYGFSPAAENALADILGQVLSKALIGNDARPHADDDSGIYLRRLRGDKLLIEYHVTDVDERLVPMRDVPSLVREAAPQSLGSMQSQALKSSIVSAAVSLVEPTTTFNQSKTEEKREAARQAVADSAQHYDFSSGELIVERGQEVTERHYRIVQRMQEAAQYLNRVQVVAGAVFLALLLIVTLFAFGRRNIRKFRPSTKDIFFMATILLLFLLITQVGTMVAEAFSEQLQIASATAWYYMIPVAAAGMLIRLVLNNEHAVIFTIVFSILTGVIADASLFYSAYTAIGTLVGVATVQQVKHRMALMWSGVTVGAVNVASILSFLLIRGEFFQSTTATLGTSLIGFGGGLFAGLVVLATLPVFEAVFSYTTDIKLLELANLNHPLLRELIMRAPGSYHHSMMVGSLCEAAAEAVDANPLLARVGAYYHDIGKAKNPRYFAENQKPGENPHDKLKPNMSALIIKNHVKDGLEMAKQHRLPKEIQDFIAQHHGTSLISYFYHRAKKMEDPDIPEVDEDDYRYPGPKPQTRETAISLLADGIEAASRAMHNPTPARLKGLVQKMINKAFTDGQLDECDLTLRDLNEIAKAMTRILTGIFHQRPEYPERDEERRQQKVTRSVDAPGSAEKGKESAEREQAEQFAENEAGMRLDGETDSADSSDDTDQRHKGAADGSSNSDGRDGSSENGSDDTDDSDEERASLPRLGEDQRPEPESD